MKKRLSTLAGGLALAGLAVMLYARSDAPAPKDKEAPPRVANSRIAHVTVYPNNALVTREVEVPAGMGSLELVVTPLPERIVNSSLYSESSEGIRVLTTRFRSRPVQEDTREEVRKLEDQIKKLQMTGQKLSADLEAIKQNMGLLTKLETFTSASTVHATEKGKLDSEATIAMAKYLMEGRTEKTKDMIALQQQVQNNTEELEFAQRKLRETSSGSSRTERDAVIVVDKTNAAPGKVRLNYLVESASWTPQYKFRAGKTSKDNVSIEYLAAVTQQTGEDWQNVALVLSTAQPMLNAAPPNLEMLAVAVVPNGAVVSAPQPMGQMPAFPGQTGVRFDNNSQRIFANPYGKQSGQQLEMQAKELRKQAQAAFNSKKEADAQGISNYAAALEQANDLVVRDPISGKNKGVPRAPKNEGPSVTYHLNNRMTVPSRNDEQVLEVARIDLEPDYYYKAVPVLTSHIYRQANLSNKSKYVLLPGEATMYNGTDFVGRMNLPLVAIGEQFTVGFGSEPQLQVQRQMMEKTRTMQGGNQVLKYEYRILISSYKPERVKVQVWDRLPHAENETMNVSVVKTSPEVCKDPLYVRECRSNNLLRWDLDVDPEMNGEKAQAIQYEFKLELDKQMTIGSFESK